MHFKVIPVDGKELTRVFGPNLQALDWSAAGESWRHHWTSRGLCGVDRAFVQSKDLPLRGEKKSMNRAKIY